MEWEHFKYQNWTKKEKLKLLMGYNIEDIKEESGSFYKNFEKYCKSEDCGRPLATSTIKMYKNLLKKFADFSKISLHELENDVQR